MPPLGPPVGLLGSPVWANLPKTDQFHIWAPTVYWSYKPKVTVYIRPGLIAQRFTVDVTETYVM